MSKSADAFRTISEVADDLDVPKHVLRFWEIKFPQIRPMKRGGGRRYYRPEDLVLLRGIQHLLHAQGYTIKGVQKILREQGIEQVKVHGLEAEAIASGAAAGRQTRGKVAAGTEAQASGRVRAMPKALKTAAQGDKAPSAAARNRAAIEAAVRELEACRAVLIAGLGRTAAAGAAASTKRARQGRSSR
jgi:DNA-binding transcriptional MerR regulator